MGNCDECQRVSVNLYRSLMRLYQAWLSISLAVLVTVVSDVSALSSRRRADLREEVREMFIHGYNGYMKYAYPADELKSVTCKPSHRDPDPANFGVNDIHPNTSLTLLDVLSSLPLINPSAYPDALKKVCTEISFDQDSKVQVFEMTIRALGSLLSTYQYLDRLSDSPKDQARALTGIKQKKVDLKKYKGRILEMAEDLGRRMLPAFETKTGLPYARVNLRHGVETGETTDTCAAGAGSLVLEFTVLSRLTGDQRFESAAHLAYMAIWNKRSEHDLIGNSIGVSHGQWLQPGFSGVGAGIDSFFEYGMKAAILLGDDTYLDIFQDSYAAIQTHVRTPDGFFYRPVQYRLLHQAASSTIDSLGAFFPGLQVLAGDLESAIKGHLVFWNLWRKHSAIPESWVWEERRIEWAGYPGRPEFVESNYYLYQATKDDFYLRVGERILGDLKRRLRTKCGFATLKNVETGEKEDRMESFVLSETLKYLYLLFDEAAASSPGTNSVFTTEGHVLSLPHSLQAHPSPIRRALHRSEQQYCPAYRPPSLGGLRVGIEQRDDYEYARTLIYGEELNDDTVHQERRFWSEHGRCAVPQVPKHSFDVILGPVGQSQEDVPPEDTSPAIEKVYQGEDGHWTITDVSGLKLGVRWRMDEDGYDISKVGPHRIRPGQEITVTDPSMDGYLPIPQIHTHESPIESILRFSSGMQGTRGASVFLHAVGATATFGQSFSPSPSRRFTTGSSSLVLIYPLSGTDGCSPIIFPRKMRLPEEGFVVLLDRGECTFLEKLVHAARVGASGAIVAGLPPSSSSSDEMDTDGLLRPSAEGEATALLKEVEDLGLVYVDWRTGDVLREKTRLKTGEITMVEVLPMDGQVAPGRLQNEEGYSSPTGRGRQAREGRVGIGEWPIWNLRIVEVL